MAAHKTMTTMTLLRFGWIKISPAMPIAMIKLFSNQPQLRFVSTFLSKKFASARMTTILASSVGWMDTSPVSIQRVAPKWAAPIANNNNRKNTITRYIGTIAPDQKR